ncbi:MAG: MerR family transcriptional regulator [Acidobacteriia bacterium]|nr:MerR family transcriptional regulator [Terriglobia bacterium]
MIAYSTREAAAKLGVTQATLSTYIKAGKIPPPTILQIGRRTVHSWTESDIEQVRKLLPKIANGRKTRYQKLREKQKKTGGAQAMAPMLQKKKKK